ncbi:MAG: hypothetical protein EAX90_04535 [Candidatus Heimdallarchaeota archaeon]|nr:hypothetical protein [Candidatus Heimdallarchaeota archaeon]
MSNEQKEREKRIDELIIDLSENPDETIRFKAIQELILLHDFAEKAIPTLIETLQNEGNYDVMYLIIGELGNFGPKAENAIPILLELIPNFYDDDEILQLIIEAFGKIGKAAKRAEEPLKQIIREHDIREMRVYAMQALERIIGSDIISLLDRIIRNDEEDEIVRIQAIHTITKIGTQEVISRLSRILNQIKAEEVKVNIESALGELGISEVIPKLLTRLKESDESYERSVAAEAMGKIRVKEAIPVLLEAAYEDPDDLVRAEAVKALGNIKSKESTQLLISILKDERNTELRLEVVQALGKIGGKEVIETLERVTEEDSEDDVRIKAIESLVEIDSSESSTILTALLYEDENINVRKAAAKALGYLGTKDVITPLVDILQEDTEDEEILELIKNTLFQIGKRGHPSALVGIIKCCDEMDIREKATNAITQIEPMKAIPELMQIMKDSDSLIRSLAAFMLSEIGKKLGFEDYEQLISAFKSGAIERNIAQRQILYELEQKKQEILAKRESAEAEQALQHERELNLRKIIKRYSEISLERMAKLLKFKDTLDLEKWLLELPDELAFQVQKEVVKIPQLLQNESREAEEAINKIINSFKEVSLYTCYYCGYPIEKDYKLCPDCGEEITKCSVCKLPIAFGDNIGFCVLCESKGHLDHLQEWVKAKGVCPHCLQKIPVENIIPVETEKKKKTR